MDRGCQKILDILIETVSNAPHNFGLPDLKISAKPGDNYLTNSLVDTELEDISEVFDSMIPVKPDILLQTISTIGRICENMDITHHIRNILKLQISEDPDEVLCPRIELKKSLSVLNGRIATHFSIMNAK